ncbi:AraC family transcriptional regulator [Pseudooceanicola sp. CBS1P-1]|uniref:Helix-turn-helix domain-containing protein n=1 Tax=Pseudooceanicola albus TaxID=2692189 RepID=A0A6L7G5Z4_9RHOB|nr:MULTISPECIES: AraC family transcriptional regulator [Pseudooceanicola]MBT9386034.1 AraC family transcriptional regulator [Pseudooceanicola endophyticus]MXN19545.1 helix-turn-helix domain-containing protein [Pseudooceanicola albus]
MAATELSEIQTELRKSRDNLGCSLKSLRHNHSARAGDLTLLRKTASGPVRSEIATPAQDRGMILGMSLLPGHRRRIREGSRRYDRVFDQDAIYIREFDVDYAATAEGAFDFLLIELPLHSPLRLRPTNEALDPRLGQMARGLLDWLARPALLDPLASDEIGARLMLHLERNHAITRRLRRRSRLSPAQLARAKEMLMSVEFEGLRLDDVALALDLPRNAFFRGFRETTGLSPYQWLLAERLEQGRLLLRLTQLPLVDIALACGFADQSHFTRMFTRAQGLSPGRWRRAVQA